MVANAETMSIECFRRRYRLRDSLLSPEPHQETPLSEVDGLRILDRAPARDIECGKPPGNRYARGRATYPWIIDGRGIPYIVECEIPALGGNPPKHTNLSGGGQAYVGGQVWFESRAALWVSGGSGRYPPIDGRQLEDAVGVFRHYGYETRSLGWDNATGEAKRYREGS